ncbi:hypothetical protein H6P81_012174 [Aristolochia fimbriata]|uniref:C2H2-type domain-containing protein n=1 Tax=Aristolochia fimbriata TaxID=158543 RepID=A0AAV7ECC3_ARIFI|nr:hypothetical protein H6P81_012174 [Aristolochia fimbriata]
MAMCVEAQVELGFPFWIAAVRKFDPNAPFFVSGNIERELLAKQFALDLTEDEKCQIQNMEDMEGRILTCPIAGCGAKLDSLENFEDHYHARHMASCSVCSRVYPTSHLLSIHISEAHDSFFQAKVARGFAMYECLVEGCGTKLKTYKSRQQHLIDKHKFPASFEFFKKALPSKKQRLRLQRKRIPCGEKTNEAKESGMEVDKKMDDLVSKISNLSTSDSSPSTVSFGRRHTRGFAFVPRSVQQKQK